MWIRTIWDCVAGSIFRRKLVRSIFKFLQWPEVPYNQCSDLLQESGFSPAGGSDCSPRYGCRGASGGGGSAHHSQWVWTLFAWWSLMRKRLRFYISSHSTRFCFHIKQINCVCLHFYRKTSAYIKFRVAFTLLMLLLQTRPWRSRHACMCQTFTSAVQEMVAG
jgi:hypothetical protein